MRRFDRNASIFGADKLGLPTEYMVLRDAFKAGIIFLHYFRGYGSNENKFSINRRSAVYTAHERTNQQAAAIFSSTQNKACSFQKGEVWNEENDNTTGQFISPKFLASLF